MSEEQIIFRGSPSVLTRFGPLFLATLVMAASIAGALLLNVQYIWLLWVLAGLALLYILGVIVVVRSHQYEVTNERVRFRKGILTKRTDELELYRVNDTTLIEPFTLRMFGLGTIEFRTADTTTPILHIEAIHGARKLREELRKHVEECRDRKRVRISEFE